MEQFNNLLSFEWYGTKKGRFTKTKWGNVRNCRKLADSTHKSNALLTGIKQLDQSGKYKLIAIDLDNKDNWSEVVKTFRRLHLPEKTFVVRTPSGGLHIYYWILKNIPAKSINGDTHCMNFEVKGDNNNITAPRSVFECGAEYKVIRDNPVAQLDVLDALRLFPHKPQPVVPEFHWEEADPDVVERKAREIDPRAKKNARGWMLRCKYHDDKQASAILFNNGYYYCSGCGEEKFIIDRKELMRRYEN